MHSFQTHTELFVPRERVFDAWLSERDQSLITGAPAIIEPRLGGLFSLWGGSVRGQIVFMKRPDVIAQTWRTDDFESHDEDSRLELRFLATAMGCQLQITQDKIPARSHQQFIHAWTTVLIPALKAWAVPTVN